MSQYRRGDLVYDIYEIRCPVSGWTMCVSGQCGQSVIYSGLSLIIGERPPLVECQWRALEARIARGHREGVRLGGMGRSVLQVLAFVLGRWPLARGSCRTAAMVGW